MIELLDRDHGPLGSRLGQQMGYPVIVNEVIA